MSKPDIQDIPTLVRYIENEYNSRSNLYAEALSNNDSFFESKQRAAMDALNCVYWKITWDKIKRSHGNPYLPETK